MSYHYGMQWCSIPKCPCGIPRRVCSNFEGFDKKYGRFEREDKETWPFRYCLCCGYERADHKPLIHNGRKRR